MPRKKLHLLYAFKGIQNVVRYYRASSDLFIYCKSLIIINNHTLQQGEDDGSDTAGHAGDIADRGMESDSNSEVGNSGDESGEDKAADKAVSTVDEEEEEAEWARFQKRINK